MAFFLLLYLSLFLSPQSSDLHVDRIRCPRVRDNHQSASSMLSRPPPCGCTCRICVLPSADIHVLLSLTRSPVKVTFVFLSFYVGRRRYEDVSIATTTKLYYLRAHTWKL